MGSIVRKNQRRICLKYRSILSINLVRYPILIEEKKIKKWTKKNRAKNPFVPSWTIPRQNLWLRNRFIAKIISFSLNSRIKWRYSVIFVGNIAAMDFASLTRQVRIYKGIDAFLSMLIGLLRTNLLSDSEWNKDLGDTRRDEFREFHAFASSILSLPPSLLFSHPSMFVGLVCSQLVRENCTNLSGTFKRIISVQFPAKKEFQGFGRVIFFFK